MAGGRGDRSGERSFFQQAAFWAGGGRTLLLGVGKSGMPFPDVGT